MSTLALRRTRMPIGGLSDDVSVLAQCLAGETYALRERDTVNRSAWEMIPALTSSYRTSPGKIGRPAASAEVQPAGRKVFDDKSKMAPEPACQLPSASACALNNSYSFQLSRSTTITCASLP